MTKMLIARGAALLITGLLLGACENRGTFGTASCDSSARTDVPAAAASAVYFDNTGTPVGANAEDLEGTAKNRMCPTPEPDGTSACPAGYCARTLVGKTYCLRC